LTIVEVLKLSADYLQKRGSESSRLDAELLLAYALKVRRLDLYLKFDRPLDEAELAAYRALIARRGKGEPVAYLIGQKEFMGLAFEVTRDVLVPNPDTEVLVQRAVAIARETQRPLRVADVGTGSGCIAVSVAHYAQNTEVWASDISPGAGGRGAQHQPSCRRRACPTWFAASPGAAGRQVRSRLRQSPTCLPGTDFQRGGRLPARAPLRRGMAARRSIASSSRRGASRLAPGPRACRADPRSRVPWSPARAASAVTVPSRRRRP
jgi:hypothetical protein